MKMLLALAREFVVQVDDAISSETLAWTADFRSGLDQAERREGSLKSD